MINNGDTLLQRAMLALLGDRCLPSMCEHAQSPRFNS